MNKPQSKGKTNQGSRESAFGSIRNELRKTHFNLGNDSKFISLIIFN